MFPKKPVFHVWHINDIEQQQSPRFLAPGTSCVKQFFCGLEGEKWFRDGSNALHLFVHFISTTIYIRSTSDHQALDPRGWEPWYKESFGKACKTLKKWVDCKINIMEWVTGAGHCVAKTTRAVTDLRKRTFAVEKISIWGEDLCSQSPFQIVSPGMTTDSKTDGRENRVKDA